jgi:DNA-binding NarL/FixJ family response regulator
VVAIAIFSIDPAQRGKLERLVRENPALALVGAVANSSKLFGLIEQHRVDIVLADAPSREYLADWHLHHDAMPLVVLLDKADDETRLDALNAGARAILARTATGAEIVAAIKAVVGGHVVLPHELLAMLLGAGVGSNGSLRDNGGSRVRLTPRELEVLTAMADGASNKAIARRLGISFHTVKFHVAAILAKLDADSRTEAVMKAAQLGLVML